MFRSTVTAAAVLAFASTVAAETATLTVNSVGAEPGTTARIPVYLGSPDLVGATEFTVDSSGLMVGDIEYTGALFANGWTGWDTAPALEANLGAGCIFPQDQVTGFDILFVDILIDVPADAVAGSEIPVTLTNAFISDYTFVPYDVEVIPGKIIVTSNSCDEDIDGDGMVDFNDLLAVISAWGTCEGCNADVNNDLSVDLSDLLTVLASWGPCS